MAERMSREKNYQNFRQSLKNVSPPCIPYLGMYLTDLTFIEDGHKDLLEGLINFVKRRQIAGVIREIQQYQQTPYFLQSVPVVKDFLKKVEPMPEEKVYGTFLDFCFLQYSFLFVKLQVRTLYCHHSKGRRKGD